MKNKWPKEFLPLTAEQQEISDDFMHYWHEVLPRKYAVIDNFNHSFPVKTAPKSFLKTLEVGAGNGEHLEYEVLTEQQAQNYYALDLRENMVAEINKRFPNISAVVGDCQERLKFSDDYFDRILAIHVLEHLPNLPDAMKELHRVCNKKSGVLQIVIPCEGSLAYTIARKVSAQRIFEKRYKQSYKWLIEREHVNRPVEIFEELGKYFSLRDSSYFPIPLKFEFCNLCIGANFVPKQLENSC